MRNGQGAITGGVSKTDGLPVEYDGLGTMSKSKLNGVDPQDMIDRYGADAARLFVMFASPPEHTIEWSDTGVEGAHRFLKRLWHLCAIAARRAARRRRTLRLARRAPTPSSAARREIHLALKQADYDYERVQYNTVVSAGMKMLNTLEACRPTCAGAAALAREGLSILLRVLYPVVPHTTWVLWNDLGFADAHRRPAERPVARTSTKRRSRATRSSSCCRSTASCAASSSCRRRPIAPRSKRRRARRRKSRGTATAPTVKK